MADPPADNVEGNVEGENAEPPQGGETSPGQPNEVEASERKEGEDGEATTEPVVTPDAAAPPAEEEDVASVLTDYDPADFVSGAVLSDKSTIPEDIFAFEHSYGYDCKKYFNLCACDETVVAWAAGSIIVFMDVKTRQVWFRRCTTGGGVGHIASYRFDPNYRIAIAENREGNNAPVIIMYTWPQMEIDAVLRDGTTNAYSVMDFSPDGEFLASIGKEPDYNITIWVWQKHKILLRTSAFTFDVFNVIFSPYCEGQLTTCGAAHIKFWKMAHTFTGLKLKGDLGRFGKTEICDVIGILPMPDEKVLSGCEWGNILVWEAGLVKVEVTQKNRKACHDASIVQLMLSEDRTEVTSVGSDGLIRSWYWDTVEQADPPEDDQFVELNFVAETQVPGANILGIRHQVDKFWYAQDGNGSIWTIDLDLDNLNSVHTIVNSSHAGPIAGLTCLPLQNVLVSFGFDGVLQVYNAEEKIVRLRLRFPSGGSTMHHVTRKVCHTGECILLGLADGSLRAIWVDGFKIMRRGKIEDNAVQEIFNLKPHSDAVTIITMNPQCTLLVTFGAENTLFMYKVSTKVWPFTLLRLGYIPTPKVNYATWKPGTEKSMLLCCDEGLIQEVELPDAEVRPYEEVTTFELEFKTTIDTVLKRYYLRNRPLPEEDDLMSLDEEDLKKEREMAMVDDDDDGVFLGEIEIVIDEENTTNPPVTWVEYEDVSTGSVWVTQEDCGCLIRIVLGAGKIDKYAPIPTAWKTTISTVKHICNNKFTMLGMHDGIIRILRNLTPYEDCEAVYIARNTKAAERLNRALKGRRLRKEDPTPIPRLDLTDFYYFSMHDRYTGAITTIAFSADSKRLYTAGKDGNIFSYLIYYTEPLVEPEIIDEEELFRPHLEMGEPTESPPMSHEELKQKEEYDKMMAIANAHKAAVRKKLEALSIRYHEMLQENREIACSQQIDVILDPRPPEELEKDLAAAEALERRKLAYPLEVSELALEKVKARNVNQLDVYPFVVKSILTPDELFVRPIRQKSLSAAFFDQLDEVHRKMDEAARLKRTDDTGGGPTGPTRKRRTRNPDTYGPLPTGPIRVPRTLIKAIIEHDRRMLRQWRQEEEIEEHMSRQPNPNVPPTGALEALREAEATLHNYPLKTDPDYIGPADHHTQLRICLTRQEVYNIKHEFNMKVGKLRADKLQMIADIKEICENVAVIQNEIPKESHLPLPKIPTFDEVTEMPEKILERQPIAASWEFLKFKNIDELTPTQREIRARRIEKRTAEQHLLINKADKLVKRWEKRLKILQAERTRVQERVQLVELHLLQLHREILVYNKFEANEDKLATRVYNKLVQVKGVLALAEECLAKRQEFIDRIEELQQEIVYQQAQFKKLTQDNPFSDFLRRIYKKKYKPPRDPDDDDSTEESSSSSSEEEDEVSLDSREIGPIRPDPNICPEGCDPTLYQKTYDMRAARHQMEQDIKDEERQIELLKKEADAHTKVANKLNVHLQKRQKDLKDFMMEKQSCLNEIWVTLVVRASQIRAAALERDLQETLVFSESRLAALRRRVGELQREIADQRARRRLNQIHMRRMNTDMKAMELEMEELKEKCRVVLRNKLGKPLQAGKILDALLARLTRRYNAAAAAYVANYHFKKQILSCWNQISEQEQKYLEAITEYSKKLRSAAALQENSYILRLAPELKDIKIDLDEFRRDVARLRIIRCRQWKKIACLRSDIARLVLRPSSSEFIPLRPPPPGDMPSSQTSAHWQPTQPRPPLVEPCTCDHTIEGDHSQVNALAQKVVVESGRNPNEVVAFLTETTDALKDVYTGQKSRFAVMETLAKNWLPDPEPDANSVGFEALQELTDLLVKKHMSFLDGGSCGGARAAADAVYNLPPVGAAGLALADTVHRAMSTCTLDCEPSIATVVASLMERNLKPSDLKNLSVKQVVEIIKERHAEVSGDVDKAVERVFSGILAQSLVDDDYVDDMTELFSVLDDENQPPADEKELLETDSEDDDDSD